jgi:uncharacterized OsmC-like protein/alpha-beta hydrolase superfamily lysophospholipase
MPTTTCSFSNDRGEQLSGRVEHPDGPTLATAVFAHCFTCSKDLRAARRVSRALADRGIAVLSYDFAGLGSSEGDFAATTFSSDIDDLVAAARHLTETMQPPSLLVGHSLGGAAVLMAAARLPGIEAVASIGAPADVSHVRHLFDDDVETIRAKGQAIVSLAGRPFPISAAFVDDLSEHHLTETVRSLDAALLFLHAPMDDTVGVDNARRLFEAARHPKSFISLADADHLLRDEADASYVAEVIASWAGRYLPAVGSSAARVRSPRPPGSYDDDTTSARTGSGLTTQVSTRGFHLMADEPSAFGGGEVGPTPYDYLAAALASCTSMTLRMYADRKGLPLEQVTTEVRYDRVHAEDCAACEHTEGRVERFTRTVALHGDLEPAARDRLLAIATRCPVHRTLDGQIEVHTIAAEIASPDPSPEADPSGA